jgi:hypothetical protein
MLIRKSLSMRKIAKTNVSRKTLTRTRVKEVTNLRMTILNKPLNLINQITVLRTSQT